MEIEKGYLGYVIGQESLSYGDLEEVCTAIDDAIALALPESVRTTRGVIDFIIEKYKDRLDEKTVYLSDKIDY